MEQQDASFSGYTGSNNAPYMLIKYSDQNAVKITTRNEQDLCI